MQHTCTFPHRLRLGLLFALSCGTLIAESDTRIQQMSTTASHVEDIPLDEMVITAPLQRPLFQQAQAASILSGQNLTLAIEPSLGQTLARMPGVSSSYFGPASSRPIIRGLDGDRVRILQNGLNTIDASATGVDHAVSFEIEP